MNFYRNFSMAKVVLLPWSFLSLRNLTSHYIPWTSKETLALQKLYCCFEVFILLEVLLRTLDMVGLEDSSLGLRFSKMFFTDLKMSTGLLKWLFDFAYFVFQIFCRKFWSIFHTEVPIYCWHKVLHLFIVCGLLGVTSIANF